MVRLAYELLKLIAALFFFERCEPPGERKKRNFFDLSRFNLRQFFGYEVLGRQPYGMRVYGMAVGVLMGQGDGEAYGWRNHAVKGFR